VKIEVTELGIARASFLQVLKETAVRPGEAVQLQWTDLDAVSHSLRLNEPEKGSNPRIWRISTKLVKMLNNMPKTSPRIFGDSSLRTKRCNYEDQRRRIAKKLQNSRLLQIKFQTFSHWKATMEYHRTKDILHVMKLLGHRNIKNTLVYTQLLPERDDEYVVKVARTLEDAKVLLECGFEYVTDMDNCKLFRKRK
jgi:integrase